MAEIFGAVASGAGLVSLSIQLFESARKLKGFCDRYEAASALLFDLAHEIETISLLLQNLEQHRVGDSHDAALMDRCIVRGREKTHEISALVNGLESRLQTSRQLGKASVALKKCEFQNMLDELERAKSSILLALQAYSMSRQSMLIENQTYSNGVMTSMLAAHGVQMDRLESENHAQTALLQQSQQLPQKTAEDIAEVDGVDEIVPRSDMRHVKRSISKRNDHRIRVSFPTWLTKRAWSLAAYRSCEGWDICIQSYNVRPHSSAIFKLCQDADLRGVRGLMSSGGASIYDCDPTGKSLLIVEHAGIHQDLGLFSDNRIDLCRYLVNEARSFWRRSNDAPKILDSWSFLVYGDVVSMYRLFIDDLETDVDLDQFSSSNKDPDVTKNQLRLPNWLVDCNDIHLVDAVLRNQPILPAARPAEYFFEHALTIGYNAQSVAVDAPAILLAWARLDSVNTAFAKYKAKSGYTALHHAARHIGGGWYENEWIDFAKSLLRLGADYHASDVGRTPLEELIIGSTGYGPCRFDKALRGWTESLLESGVDVYQYNIGEGVKPRKQRPRKYRKGFFCRRSALNINPKWSNVELYRTTRVQRFQLQHIPGAWMKCPESISTIFWRPNSAEKDEGVWKRLRSVYIRSKPFDYRRDMMLQSHGSYPDIVTTTAQDDTSILAIRVNKRKHDQFLTRKRSTSQPPSTRGRESAYYQKVESSASWAFKPHHDWRPSCHVCPFDGKLRFDCHFVQDETIFDDNSLSAEIASVRDCVQGLSVEEKCVQETNRWKQSSFFNYGESTMQHWGMINVMLDSK